MKSEDTVMSLVLDTTAMDEKIVGLTNLVKSRFPDSVPERLHGEFSSLCNDVTFGEGTTTVEASGIRKFIQGVDFGRSFDVLTAAIRAGNFDNHC